MGYSDNKEVYFWGVVVKQRLIRKEYPQIPPKVEYRLSDKGRSLMEIIEQLCVWGEVHKS